MKTVKNQSLKRMSFDLEKHFKIEVKLLTTNERLTDEEVAFLKRRSDEGAPIAEFSYGLYYLLNQNDEKTAEEWWNKFFYHANGWALWKASGIFAYLGDQYYEWSMRCLRRSAWRQFPIAKDMLKAMKETPFKFPEA